MITEEDEMKKIRCKSLENQPDTKARSTLKVDRSQPANPDPAMEVRMPPRCSDFVDDRPDLLPLVSIKRANVVEKGCVNFNL